VAGSVPVAARFGEAMMEPRRNPVETTAKIRRNHCENGGGVGIAGGRT